MRFDVVVFNGVERFRMEVDLNNPEYGLDECDKIRIVESLIKKDAVVVPWEWDDWRDCIPRKYHTMVLAMFVD